MGTVFFLFSSPDNQSRSDCARPEAVLGVGATGGRPLPQWGSGGVTPGNFFASYFASGDFSWVSVVKKVVLFAIVVDKRSKVSKQIPELTVI